MQSRVICLDVRFSLDTTSDIQLLLCVVLNVYPVQFNTCCTFWLLLNDDSRFTRKSNRTSTECF